MRDTVRAFVVEIGTAKVRVCRHGFSIDSAYGQWLSDYDIRCIKDAIEEALSEKQRRESEVRGE